MNPFRRRSHGPHRRRFAGRRSAGFAHEALEPRSMLAITVPSSAYTEGGTQTDLFNSDANSDFGGTGSLVLNVTNVAVGDRLDFGSWQSGLVVDLRTAVATTASGTGNVDYAVSVDLTNRTAAVTFSGSSLGAARKRDITSAVTFWSTSDNPARATNPTVTITDNGAAPAGGTASNTVTVTNANDAPVLTAASPRQSLASVAGAIGAPAAGSTANSTLVSSLLGNVTDADTGAASGMAIVSANTTNGTLWYTTNAGTTWTQATSGGAISTSSALLLPSTARLYWQPGSNANYSSTAFTFRAWDQTSGTVAGRIDTTVTRTAVPNDTLSFSSVSDTVNASVTSSNTAPVLDATQSPVMTAISEDTAAPANGSTANSTLVSALVGGISDVDASAVSGIAITAVNTTNGSLRYSTDAGATWTAVGTVSDTSALLLASDANTRLAFVPSANFNGTISDVLTFRAWDQTSGTAGTKVDVSTNGVATAFSAATDTVAITVNAVNDAPVLTGGGTLGAVSEDTASPSGAALSSLGITANDTTDSGTIGGYAIVSNGANASTQGAWQYSTNSGANWFDIGTVSDGSTALALSAATLVRFVPVANFNGAPTSLTIRALDGSYAGGFSTTAGTQSRVTVDTSSNGGSTSISSATASITTSITVVNDAPVLTGGGTLGAVNEDTASPSGAALSSLGITANDTADSGTIGGYAIVSNGANASTQGAWQYSTNSGTNWFDIGTVSDGSTALALSAATLVRFVPVANFNGAPTSLTIRALDGSYAGGFSTTAGTQSRVTVNTSSNGGSTSVSSATASITTSITAVNDAPVASGSASLTAVNEDTASPSGATVSTLFSSNFSDATDTVTNGSSANTLLGVVVTANAATSGQGKWQWLNGSTWTDISTALTNSSGRFYSAATSLRFLPAANFNGTPGALTVRLVDSSITAPTNGGSVDVSTNGGTTAYSSGTVSLSTSITSVNDAPAGTNKTVAFNQDTSYTLAASDFGFTDTSDNPANSLAAVKIASLPSAGSLRYNGTAITQTQVNAGYEVSKADIDSGRLVFVPVAAAFGTAYASFTFQVRDNGGTANGGVDTDPTARTFTFNVSKVDNVAPAFTSGTTAAIKTNTNLLYTAVATDAVNFTNGVVTYGLQGTPQLNNASTSLSINASTGAVTTASGLAQVGTYTFTVTASDASGNTSTRAVTVTATALSTGAIDLSSPSSDWNVLLAGPNYDPSDDTQANAAKGLDLVGNAANPMFYSRYNADTGEIAFRIRQETATPKGVFYLIGLINPNSGVTNADTKILGFIGIYIDSSTTIDANGVPSKFTVAFYDTGSNSNTSPSTSSFVTRGATVPTGSSAHVMAVGGGSNLDPTDTSGPDGFVSFKFSAVQFEAWAKSRLTPGTNAYSVTDPLAIVVMTATQNNSINGDFGGLLGSSGQSYKDLGIATPAVLANNPPQSADTAVTTTEDTTYTFTASDFPFADADSGDTLQKVRVDSLPAKGTLRLNGTAVTVGTVVTATQLSQSRLTYAPPANESGLAYATFRFSVNDNKSWNAVPQTATINVTPANDPPVISLLNGDVAYWTDSNVPVPFDSTPSAVVSDSDSLDFDTGVLTIAVTGGTSADNLISIVQGGSIAVNGTEVLYNGVAIGTIGGTAQTLTISLNANATQAGVSALISAARFTYLGSEGVPAIRTITVSVTDGDGGTSNTATVQMVGPPIYVVEGNEDTTISANQAPKNVEGSSTVSQIAAANGTHVKLLVVNGTLTYTRSSSSRTAAVNDVLTIAELQTLSFTPPANAYGDGLASFRFSYCDASGNATGVLQQPTVFINVLPVNDPPVAAADGVSGAVLTGSITELAGTAASTEVRTATGTVVFSDVDFSDTLTLTLSAGNVYAWSGGSLTNAQKSALDAAISLSLGSASGSTTATAQFAKADWSVSAADRVFDFLAVGETLSVTRTAQVSDGTATASATITVTFIGTNDVPVITTTDPAQLGGTINEVAGSSNFGGATLSGTIAYTDLDRNDTHVATVVAPAIAWNDGTGVKTAAELETALGTAAFTTIVNAASAPGTFAVGTPSTSGGAGSVGWTFTPAAAFKFLRTGQSLELTYTVQVDDQNGGVATQDVVVVVNGVSDAPAGADATLGAHQNEPLLLTDSNFGFSDADNDNRVSVIITTLPTAGKLQFKNGSDAWVDVVALQEISFADVMAGRLRFVPVTGAAAASPYGSFTFQVKDDGSANPLQNTDQSPNTITFNLLDFRGPNQTVPLEQEIDEDAALVFSGAKKISIAMVGEDGIVNDVETIRTTLAVTAGTLTLGSTPAGLSITGNGSNSIELQGLRSAVNAAIDGLRFDPGADLNSIVPGGKHTFTTLTVTTVNVPALGGFLYATDTDTVDIGVTPVNDAPVATGSAMLAAVDEDTASPPGASVATLFAGNFGDAADAVVGGSSANTLVGIAIVGYMSDATKGVWQYSSDGTTWTTLSNVTGDAAAFTLKASDSLRFLPALNYFGTPPSLTCRLIESGGATVTTAATVNVSANGGTTAISAGTVVLSTAINSINDLPVPTYETDLTANEDGAVINRQLTSTDVDNVDPPTYSLEGDPIPGLTINSDGSFSFDPSDVAYQSLAVGEIREITVTYRVTDDQGGFATKSFKITVTGIDDPQTAVSLTNSTIPENSAVGTAVGSLQTADSDATDTFTYTLVAGDGDADNAKFEIVDGELRAKQSFDFESPVGSAGNVYKIRVRSTADAAGRLPAVLESELTVTVLNVLEKLGVTLVTDSVRDDLAANDPDKVTNVGTVAISPTGNETVTATSAATDSRVRYSIDGGQTWTDSFIARQGVNQLRVRQVDPAGLLDPSEETAFTFTLDTVAAAPTVGLTTDTGSSSSDKVTNVGTLAVGRLEEGTRVEYSNNDGPWSTSFTAVEGLNSVWVRQVDVAGNVSAATAFVFTYDPIAVAPTVALSSDTGVSASDGITRVGLIRVTGIETGAKVEYSTNSGETWTSTFTPSPGRNTVNVRQTDIAGNVSPITTLEFTVDTTAATPTVRLASDTGTSPTDKITNVGTLEVGNTETDALVEYSTNGGVTWSQSFTAVQGLNTVRVRQTDKAGNVSPVALFTFTFDGVVAMPAVVLTRDTGIFGDRITNVGTLVVTGVETGARVEYATTTDGSSWSAWATSFTAVEGQNTVKVRQTDVAGNVSPERTLVFTLDTGIPAAPSVALLSDTGVSNADLVTRDGRLSLGGVETAVGTKVEYQLNTSTAWTTTFTPVQGLNTVKVRQTDVSGNVSQSGTLTFRFDTTAPRAPTLSLANDTGASPTDRITNQGGLNTANVEANAVVQYSRDGVTWSATLPTPSQGANSVRVRQTDEAGNVSPVTTLAFTLDVTAPSAPTVALSSDTGTSSTDRITRVGTLAPRGESGARFEYSADGSTGWSSVFTPSEGANSVYVRQVDIAGNPSIPTPTPFMFTLDTIAPTTAPAVALLNDTGIVGDLRTRDGRLSIAGLDVGARAEYQLNAATTWLPTFTPVQGLNTVKVRQADVAGNGSPFTTFEFTLDSVAARVTAVTLTETAPYAVGSTVTFKVKFSEAVSIGGTGTSNLSLALRFSSGATRSAVYQSGSGTDELLFSYVVVDADKAATITQATVTLPTGRTLQDGFGNTSTGSSLSLTLPSRIQL